MNKAILLGRVGQDPETTPVGDSSVTKFSLATSRRYTTNAGEKKEDTQWHNVEAWGAKGEAIATWVKKGQQILIQGEIIYDQYEVEGQKRTSTKIRLNEFEFVSSPKQDEAGKPKATPAPQAVVANGGAEADDLPF